MLTTRPKLALGAKAAVMIAIPNRTSVVVVPAKAAYSSPILPANVLDVEGQAIPSLTHGWNSALCVLVMDGRIGGLLHPDP